MTKLRNFIAAALLTAARGDAECQRADRRTEARRVESGPAAWPACCYIYHGRTLVARCPADQRRQALAVSAIMARNASVLRITI